MRLGLQTCITAHWSQAFTAAWLLAVETGLVVYARNLVANGDNSDDDDHDYVYFAREDIYRSLFVCLSVYLCVS